MKEIVSDPRSQQMYTMTPLHVAVDKNDYESVYFFCSALSNILQKSESGIVAGLHLTVLTMLFHFCLETNSEIFIRHLNIEEVALSLKVF